MRTLPLVCGALGCALMAHNAFADNFAEAVIGVAAPVGDDDYDNVVDNSLKLGARVGSIADRGGGVEIDLDFTPYDDDFDSQVADGTALRFRALIGGRYQVPVAKGAHFYVRGGVGMDLAHFSLTSNLGPLGTFEASQTDVGLGVELGAGVNVSLGKLTIGGAFAVPMGFHFNDDDPQDNGDFDFEYNAYDLDFLVTVGTVM